MASNGGWVYVDDTDPSIIYSGGDWKVSKDEGPSSDLGVFNGTLHGAIFQGITATLKFTGACLDMSRIAPAAYFSLS